MTDQKALAVRNVNLSPFLNPRTVRTAITLHECLAVADFIMRSGLAPRSIQTPQACAVIILMGYELGMPLMQSLKFIDVIQGKATLSPAGMMALVMESGELEDFIYADDGEKATVTVKRKGIETPYTDTFSVADSMALTTTETTWVKNVKNKRTIPLGEKSNWVQQPRVMRKWRCVSAVLRVVFADKISRFYTQDEMEANVIYDDEGNLVAEVDNSIVDGTAVVSNVVEDTEDGGPHDEPAPDPKPPANGEADVVTITGQFEKGALTYGYRNGELRVQVNFNGKIGWLLPEHAVVLSKQALDAFEGLFANKHEMIGHLKKYTNGKATAPHLLTWEEFMMVVRWKRDQVADDRMYPEHAEKPALEPDRAIEVFVDVYNLPREDVEAWEFARNLVKAGLTDELLPLWKNGVTWEKNRDDLINLSALLANGTIKVDTDDYNELVNQIEV